MVHMPMIHMCVTDGPKYKPSSNHCCNSAGSMTHCGSYNNWNVGVKPICACE